MPHVTTCLVSLLLLLAVSGCLGHVSFSTPARMRNRRVTGTCVIKARALLENIRQALSMETMFIGINCSEQKSTLASGARTASVCVPENCSGVARDEFDERICLESIVKDLRLYETFLVAQPDPLGLLATTVLRPLQELLRENTLTSQESTVTSQENTLTSQESTLTSQENTLTSQENTLTSQAPPAGESTFDQRLRLCKVLKGLQVRSLTINRALNYIYTEGHRK